MTGYKGDTDRPIFLIGMPRSGTTVISEAISLHEDLGYFSNFLNYAPSQHWLALLDRVVSIPVVGRRLRGRKPRHSGFSEKIKVYLPYCSETYTVWEYYCGKKFLWDYLINQTASETEKNGIKKGIKTVLNFQGKKRFFNKLTGPPRIHYLNSIFPDAYFIHVIRDPRAVVSSLMKVGFWQQNGLKKPWWQNGLPHTHIQEWIANQRSPVALAAVQWKWIVELTWKEKEEIGDSRFVEIQYEDFLKNPHETIRNVFGRLELGDSHPAHQYLDSAGKVINWNQKYKKSLSDDEIRLIERIAGPIALKAGYEF